MKLIRKRRSARDQLRALVDQDNVPSFPNVVAEAIQQVTTPDVELSEVAQTISADPRLTLAVLKLVNSPSFAARNPITSVHRATVLLGRRELESLLIATGVSATMPTETVGGYSPKEFWYGASLRAITASAIAAVVDPAARYDLFTAALLQDMAQPILFQHDLGYSELVKQADSHPRLAELEHEAMGYSHAELGALMCREWGLPDALSSSIAAHHDSSVEGHMIVRCAGLIDGREGITDELIAQLADRLGLDDASIRELLLDVERQASEMTLAFSG